MYEQLHQWAAALSLAHCALGFVVAALIVQVVGKLTLGPRTWWKAPLSLVYIAAILSLLFFTYALAMHLFYPE